MNQAGDEHQLMLSADKKVIYHHTMCKDGVLLHHVYSNENSPNRQLRVLDLRHCAFYFSAQRAEKIVLCKIET